MGEVKRNTVKWDVISHHLEGLIFGTFSQQDIEKLSVQAITRSETIDILNQPVPNGLCDPKLGPLEDMNDS